MFLVSIIIPNYNHAQFLEQRILSVLNQSYINFEIIIIDDASTDDSVEIINKFKNNNKISKIIFNKENLGSPFKTWNKGFKYAKGDLIWIAESDDYSDKDFLKKMIVPFCKDNNVVLSFSRSNIVDEEGKLLQVDSWGKEDMDLWHKSFVIDGDYLLKEYQLYKNTITNASSVLFKKEILNKLSDNYLKFKATGDWLFWNEILLFGRVAFINLPLNYWRVHNQTTRSIGNYEKEKLKIYEQLEVIELSKEQLSLKIKYNIYKWQWLIDRWIARFSYNNLLKISYINVPFPLRLKFQFYNKLINRFLKEIKNSIKKYI